MMKTILQHSAITFLGILISLLLVSKSDGEVGPGKKAVKHRQARQHERIHQGVKSGELTKEEAHLLRKEQRDVKKEKKEAREDGVVTTEEKKQIKEMQNEASKDIYEEKHDEDKQ